MHDKPAPDMRSDAMVVKMIEWLCEQGDVTNGRCAEGRFCKLTGADPKGGTVDVELLDVIGDTLADAVLEAVLAAPEAEAKVR